MLAAQIRFVLLSQKCGELSFDILFLWEYCGIAVWLSFLFVKNQAAERGGTEKKMKEILFTGAATAIITPLNEKGVDYNKFSDLLEWQISKKIDAIVAVGTTGEGSTLTDEEHKEAIRFCVEQVKGRVPVIAGTGSNDTAYAVELSRYAKEVGSDGLLLVTPYYNKATQKGMQISFEAVANEVKLPSILYNVPSRTGCNLLPETVARLAENPYVVGVKEASGNISQIAKLASLVGDEIAIYSGNDDQIIPVLSLGGKGVISVLSNLLPTETSQMCHLYMEGETKAAAKMQLDYIDLIDALFSEVNPIPVKAAMAAMGFCDDYLRLPLTPMEAKNREVLLALMRKAGLFV